MVSGQGFHNFIINNYTTLQKEKRKIYYVVPAFRLDFGFEIEPISSSNKNQSSFRLEIKNKLLALIASHITVTYQNDSKRLLVYDGLSNVSNDRGGQYNAKIEYNYKSL